MLFPIPLLSRAVAPWTRQVAAASLASALLVAIGVAAVGRGADFAAPVRPDPAMAQLTSGGKFAARIGAGMADIGAAGQTDSGAAALGGIGKPIRAMWLPGRTGLPHATDGDSGERKRNTASTSLDTGREPAMIAPEGVAAGEDDGVLTKALGSARPVASLFAATGRALFEHAAP